MPRGSKGKIQVEPESREQGLKRKGVLRVSSKRLKSSERESPDSWLQRKIVLRVGSGGQLHFSGQGRVSVGSGFILVGSAPGLAPGQSGQDSGPPSDL